MADINGIPYVESSDLVSAYPAVSQSLAQEVSDQLALKVDSASPTFTGVASFADGTNSAPSITNTGDTDTGLFFAADNEIAITTNGAERLRVTTNIGIGTTTPTQALVQVDQAGNAVAVRANVNAATSTATPALVLSKYDNNNTTSQVLAQFLYNNATAGLGQINGNGPNQAAFGSYSDERLKENVEPLGDELAKITALQPVEFDYTDGSGHQIGFIAQEVQPVYPDLVSADENGYLMLSGLGKNEARLVRALQQAAQRIEALEARCAAAGI